MFTYIYLTHIFFNCRSFKPVSTHLQHVDNCLSDCCEILCSLDNKPCFLEILFIYDCLLQHVGLEGNIMQVDFIFYNHNDETTFLNADFERTLKGLASHQKFSDSIFFFIKNIFSENTSSNPQSFPDLDQSVLLPIPQTGTRMRTLDSAPHTPTIHPEHRPATPALFINAALHLLQKQPLNIIWLEMRFFISIIETWLHDQG